MRTPPHLALIAPFAVLSLAACARTPPPEEPMPNLPPLAQGCNAEPGNALIGQKATAETGAQALQLTGARTLRWGPPNAVFTMDYRSERVNVMYDESMTINQVTCG